MSATERPIDVMLAKEMLLVSLARAVPESGPMWRTPKGGTIKVQWMPRLGAYRFTVDLVPPLPFPETWSTP